MSQIVPPPIEEYLARLNLHVEPLLDDVARQGHDKHLPIVPPETGALLELLARAVGAQRILEIGTANGYSGLWLARALPPGGAFFTIEIEPANAAMARENFARAGLSDRTNVMVGDGGLLVSKVSGPFDLIFQDSDKFLYEPMLERLIALLRPGGLLVTDNALWGGEVVRGYVDRPRHEEGSAQAIDSYNRRLATDERLQTVFLPLGDGVAVSLKR